MSCTPVTERLSRPFFPLPPLRRSHSPHSHTFSLSYDTIGYDRLEQLRVKQLGMDPDKYSRHFSVKRDNVHLTRTDQDTESIRGICEIRPRTTDDAAPKTLQCLAGGRTGKRKGLNLMAPFTTLSVKPTCGYFFRSETDNTKKNFGIPASDLVRYRNFRMADRQ